MTEECFSTSASFHQMKLIGRKEKSNPSKSNLSWEMISQFFFSLSSENSGFKNLSQNRVRELKLEKRRRPMITFERKFKFNLI